MVYVVAKVRETEDEAPEVEIEGGELPYAIGLVARKRAPTVHHLEPPVVAVAVVVEVTLAP
jgi:hypothetical protein